MESLFGVSLYIIGYIMMLTMVLDAMDVIDRVGPIAMITFLIFGYLLCLTGFAFVRRASEAS